MKTKTMTLVLALGSWVAFAQHDHASHDQKKNDQSSVAFKDTKLGAAYDQYILVKDALVASNAVEVKKGAPELQKALKHAKASAAAITASQKLTTTTDLNEQRKIFSMLSDEMTTLVKGGKLASGALYLEYCPMANNNTGAYWLSNEKEIKNPYFGKSMLKCGSVKETIQ